MIDNVKAAIALLKEAERFCKHGAWGAAYVKMKAALEILEKSP